LIESLKDLEKLLRVLRKQGVFEFEHNGTRLKLGDLPRELVTTQEEIVSSDPYSDFPEGMLSGDALKYYSAGGVVGEEPEGLLDKQ
jgi:hypothetical protein